MSLDGTVIGFTRVGQGSPVILVDGALCYRGMGSSKELAELLAEHFTVFTYDRRGRGESGDTSPYAVEREIQDLEAILIAAGGVGFVWGMSSGAALALDAATRLTGIRKLALYEAPFIVDDSRLTTEADWVRIGLAVAADRRGDAVKFFLKSVGVPAIFILLLQLTSNWKKLKATAQTLPYDGEIVRENQRGEPLSTNRWAKIRIPVIVMNGEKSATWMRNANRSLARVVPNAQHCTLKGQTHMLKPGAHAPALVKFFLA